MNDRPAFVYRTEHGAGRPEVELLLDVPLVEETVIARIALGAKLRHQIRELRAAFKERRIMIVRTREELGLIADSSHRQAR